MEEIDKEIRAWGFLSMKTGRILPQTFGYRQNAIEEANHFITTPKIIRVIITPAKRKNKK